MEFPLKEDDLFIIEKEVENMIMQTKENINNVKIVTFKNTAFILSELMANIAEKLGVLEIVFSCYTNKTIREIASKIKSKIEKSYFENIESNKIIYEKIKNINIDKLNEQEGYFFKNLMKNFSDSGFNLNKVEFERFSKNVNRISELNAEFNLNIFDFRGDLWVSLSELKGISNTVINSMEKKDNKYKISTEYPIILPIIEEAEIELTRKKAYLLKNNSAIKNKEVLLELIKLCNENAILLGYKSYAEKQFSGLMVKTVDRVKVFLEELTDPIKNKYNDELELLKITYPEYFIKGKIKPWNISYLINKYNQEKLKYDKEKIREYFSLNNVIDSIKFIWERFYGYTFDINKSDKVWNNDVFRIDVYNEINYKKNLLGYIYIDLFPREGKYNHAMCISTKVKKHRDDFGVSVVVCNFRKPTDKIPSLLSIDEIKTLYHECGHALHNLIGFSEMPSNSGYNSLLDFVEMPSQIMEQWMNENYILEMIGKHYITNEGLSDDLIYKILEEKKIFAGVTYMKLLYQSLLSLNYYTDTKYILDNNYSQDLYKSLVTNVDFKDIHTNIEYSFLHLSGYYAAYYNYLWSQVFTIDIYNNIKENGGLLNVNFGKRFANMILSKGGSVDPNILVENYLGRPFKTEPFFAHLGGKN